MKLVLNSLPILLPRLIAAGQRIERNGLPRIDKSDVPLLFVICRAVGCYGFDAGGNDIFEGLLRFVWLVPIVKRGQWRRLDINGDGSIIFTNASEAPRELQKQNKGGFNENHAAKLRGWEKLLT
jgi:hypothetical protein